MGYDTSYYDPSGGYFDGYSYTTAYTTATGSSVSDYGEYYGTNGSYYSPSGEYYTSSSSYYSFESNDYYIFSGYIDSEARYWTFELLDSYFDPTTRKIYDTVNNTERDITTRGEVYFNEEDGNYYNTSTGNYFEGTYYYRPDGSYYDDSDGYYYDALGGYYDPEQNLYNLASSAYFDTNTNNFYPNSSDNFVYFDAEKNRYQNSDNGSYLDPITHRIINTDGTYFEPDGGYYYQTDGSYVDSKNRTYHIPDVGYVEDIIEVGDYSSPAFQWSYIGEKLDGRYYDFGGGFFEDDTRVEIPNDNYYLPTEDYYNVKKNQFYSKSGFYLNQQQDSLYYHYVDDTTGTEEERIINPIAYALPNIATRGKDYNLSPFAGEKFVSVLGKRTGQTLRFESLFHLVFDPDEIMSLQLKESTEDSSDYLIGWSTEVTKSIEEPPFDNSYKAYFQVSEDDSLNHLVGTIEVYHPNNKPLTYYLIGDFLEYSAPEDVR
ncbi:Hemolysin-type calcium-binding region [Crocosphaera watsonii WH 8502]|uniref:Hemolysin-type calcium-binding region n=1 Tax=Crocosphaera watsonii WH 8502 TaxID=423474 RepID=T2IB08_CROWT|nr:Hemolysin-type calcium-binding region [Crocosphaera watsonii WH 8502]